MEINFTRASFFYGMTQRCVRHSRSRIVACPKAQQGVIAIGSVQVERRTSLQSANSGTLVPTASFSVNTLSLLNEKRE